MIPVSRAPEPSNFDALVRQPGLHAIAELVGEQPAGGMRPGPKRKAIAASRDRIPPEEFPPFWREVLDDLLRAYNEICAYSCLRIHPFTGAASVDHFTPVSRNWQTVYEWNNYRLACSRMNARKGDFSDVLDPFEIHEGWFELELVGFQVLPGTWFPINTRRRVNATIERLQLNDAALRATRESHAQDYWSGQITLAVLRRDSPFVAREIERQKRLV